ncbi:MAG: hypothetical protein O7B35_17615, partial [Deltaproteobacteria bacterium]|nr:hypothetical protein [Deltaproteobacteria bacterium]
MSKKGKYILVGGVLVAIVLSLSIFNHFVSAIDMGTLTNVNPCAAKTINPCAVKALNPCAAKTL